VLPLLVAVGLTACFVVALVGYRMMRADPDLDLGHGLDAVTVAERRTSLVGRGYLALSDRLSAPVLSVMGPGWRTRTATRISMAGRPDGLTVAGFAGRKGAFTAASVAVGLTFLLRGSVFLGLLLMVIGSLYLDVWLRGLARRRQAQIEAELPDFLDVLSVTVGAGLGFRAALDRVGQTLRGPLAEEVTTTLRRMDVGVARRQAFEELRERNPASETLSLFVTALLQAEELGAPLGETLVNLGGDMRREFAQTARRRAARAVPRVSLIITMVIIPAIVVLLMVGLLLGTHTSLGSVTGG
jgi:tight adherence protein C